MPERRAGLLALIVSLALGVVAGVVLVHQAPTLFFAPAVADKPVHWLTSDIGPSGFPQPTPDPLLMEGEHPGDAGPPLVLSPQPTKVISALHALGAKQTANDVYPLPEFLTSTAIVPSSVHRVLTTGDGSTLWIGRTTSTLCLLFSSSNPYPTNGISAGASCHTLGQFSDAGIVLQEGHDHWTWDGVQFTTTIEQ